MPAVLGRDAVKGDSTWNACSHSRKAAAAMNLSRKAPAFGSPKEKFPTRNVSFRTSQLLRQRHHEVVGLDCRTITVCRSSVTRSYRWRHRNGIVRRYAAECQRSVGVTLKCRSSLEATRCFRTGCDFTNSASSAYLHSPLPSLCKVQRTPGPSGRQLPLQATLLPSVHDENETLLSLQSF